MLNPHDTNADTFAGRQPTDTEEEVIDREAATVTAEAEIETNLDVPGTDEKAPPDNNTVPPGSDESHSDEAWGDEKEVRDAAEWLAELHRRMRHRSERGLWEKQGSQLASSRGTTGGGSASGGGFTGVPNGSSSSSGSSSGGVAGPSQGGSSSSKQGSSQDQQEAEVDFDEFGYPDSPTQSWLAQNSDLSPLQILDNINLKSEFPYSSAQGENDKPPDISNIGMDSTTANLLQFAASVPVPDHSTTFLDIGLDTFQSLYEDHLISDLIPANNNFTTFDQTFTTLKGGIQVAYKTESHAVDLKSLGIQLPLHGVSAGETIISAVQPPLGLRSLIEPLPASALQGLIKVEPSAATPATSIVKEEEEGDAYACGMYSPQVASPGSPGAGGGKAKTSRKKSTASTDEEDDISNIPSLQMRIQIIQQRVSEWPDRTVAIVR